MVQVKTNESGVCLGSGLFGLSSTVNLRINNQKMTKFDVFSIYNITTVNLMLVCAIDSLFVLQNPNLT